MSEVVAIDGGPVPAKGEPLPKLIACLEEKLERAKAGDIQAMVIATMDGDHCCDYAIAGHVGFYSLMGALSYAQHDLLAHNRDMED